jgi:hypothetical protein
MHPSRALTRAPFKRELQRRPGNFKQAWKPKRCFIPRTVQPKAPRDLLTV